MPENTNPTDSRELICCISLKTALDAISDDEANVLKSDWLFFLEPYLTEFIARPDRSKQDKRVFTVSFQCKEYMQEIVENFIDITMRYHDDYEINLSFAPIDRRL